MYQNTWRHVSEYSNIHTYRRRNLKFRTAQRMITQYKQFHIQTSHYLYVLLVVHLGTIFVNNQLEAQFFFMCVYFYSLHVSGSHVHIIRRINPLNTEINPICHLLALLGARHILHVSGVRVKEISTPPSGPSWPVRG